MEEIVKRIWTLSTRVHDREAYEELTRLTRELIKLYDAQGRLTTDPFQPSRERIVSLPFEEVNQELRNATCVVTGGLGCVGSILVNELLRFDVKSIIILDSDKSDTLHPSDKVVRLHCDIRDFNRLQEIFAIYLPDVVFHTAAQRDPGRAETHIEETVTTNVLGTVNVVRACERSGSVRQMIWSSTGKASRYITEEIYAGTKKIGEFILDTYARTSKIKYAMVRYTHILDNSLMNAELREASENNDYVPVHSPGKYVTAQNAQEAAHLMLNALIYSEEKQCHFLLMRHLAWPVESLEMALYYIKQSGGAIPIVFVGNPVGYSEKFFRGQLDWSRPSELNLLMNVYERKHYRLNTAGDIVISCPCATDRNVLEKVLDKIEDAKGEQAVRIALVEGLKELVCESLKLVDKKETVDILRWGAEPKFLEMEKVQISDFNYLVPLLVASVADSDYSKEVDDLLYLSHSYVAH